MPVSTCAYVTFLRFSVRFCLEGTGKVKQILCPVEEDVCDMPFILNNLMKVKGSCMLRVIS